MPQSSSQGQRKAAGPANTNTERLPAAWAPWSSPLRQAASQQPVLWGRWPGGCLAAPVRRFHGLSCPGAPGAAGMGDAWKQWVGREVARNVSSESRVCERTVEPAGPWMRVWRPVGGAGREPWLAVTGGKGRDYGMGSGDGMSHCPPALRRRGMGWVLGFLPRPCKPGLCA